MTFSHSAKTQNCRPLSHRQKTPKKPTTCHRGAMKNGRQAGGRASFHDWRRVVGGLGG